MTDHNDHHAIDISINAKSQRSQNMSALESINETREVWCFGGEKLKLLPSCSAMTADQEYHHSRIPMQPSEERYEIQADSIFLSQLFLFTAPGVTWWQSFPHSNWRREFRISCGCDQQRKCQNFFCGEKLNLLHVINYFADAC